MLLPGFEPGSSDRKSEVIDRATLQEHKESNQSYIFKVN